MTDIAKAAQESSDLALWQAYCEKKMALEDAADEIERLRAERDEAIDQRNAADFVLALSIKQSNRHSVERDEARAALALGIHMREAQTTYFKTRSKDALVAAKALEAEFLHRARAVLAKEPGHD